MYQSHSCLPVEGAGLGQGGLTLKASSHLVKVELEALQHLAPVTP